MSVMHRTLFLLLLLVSPVGSATAQVPKDDQLSAETEARVAELLDQLSSTRFSERNQATSALWKMGPEIVPLLKARVKDLKLDSRQRVQEILDLLELEITPETPARLRRWLLDFKSSSRDKQLAQVNELLKQKDSDTLTLLLNLLAKGHLADARPQILEEFIRVMRQLPNDQQTQSLALKALQVIAVEQTEERRISLLDSFFAVPAVSQSIVSSKWTGQIMDLLTETKLPASRRAIMGRLSRIRGIDSALADSGHLSQWIELSAAETDSEVVTRTMHVAVLGPNIKSSLHRGKRLAYLVEQLSPVGKREFLLKLTLYRDHHDQLIKQLGPKAAVELYQGIAPPEASLQLLGRTSGLPLMMGTAGTALLKGELAKQGTPAEHRALITGILEGWRSLSSRDRADVDKTLPPLVWQALQSGEEPWQLQPLALAYASPELMGELMPASTVDRMIRMSHTADLEANSFSARQCSPAP